MPIYQAVVLALVQAATEFLPVSSTAHLILVRWLAGWEDPGLFFDVALHVGTLVAVLIYFAKTWIRLVFLAMGQRVLPPAAGEWDEDLYTNRKLFLYLILATFPAGVAGLLFKDAVEGALRSPLVIGVMLIVVGLIIAWADRREATGKTLGDVTLTDALLIGCAQAVALIPGTSRAGATISMGLMRGLARPTAARFSFLLSTPIILGASLKTGLDALEAGMIRPEMYVPLSVGIAVSAVAGYAVIAWLLRYLQRANMSVFVVYRIAFGIIVLALAGFFRLPGSAS